MLRRPLLRRPLSTLSALTLAAAAACVAVAPSCVALVEEPTLLQTCTGDDPTCPDDLECGYYGNQIERDDGESAHACVPAGCLNAALCLPECLCACQGCGDDQVCDVQHSASDQRDDGAACVDAACFDPSSGEFQCGPVTLEDDTTIDCFPCDG